MDLKTLTDEQLIARTKRDVEKEKASTIEVVKDFQEIFERRTYLKYGHSSLFAMAIKEFGYCNGSAQLRINAMRLVRDVPEAEAKIQSGELKLTAASEIQGFLYAQQRSDKGYSPEQKSELIETCLNKSVDAVRGEFAERDPKLEKRDFVRKTRKGRVRSSHSMSAETEAKLKRIKNLWSHVDPVMSRGDLIDRMCEITLDKIDPLRKAQRAEVRKSKSTDDRANRAQPRDSILNDESCQAFSEASDDNGSSNYETPQGAGAGDEVVSTETDSRFKSKKRSRYIRADQHREVVLENQDRGCCFVSPITGDRCGSDFQLQRDHVVEFARGGSHEAKNLRMYCAQHNRARNSSVVREREVLYA